MIIRPAAEADADAAARVLAGAFADDPHITGLLPEDRRQDRMEQMFRFETLSNLRTGGHVYLAVDTADAATASGTDTTTATTATAATTAAPLGVAFWGAPGQEAGWREQLTEAVAMRRIYGRRFKDVKRTYREVARYRPKAPHWYLKVIGTAPEARGRGVGSALIRHGLAQADRAGVGVYLESSTPENVPIYARYGFVEISEIPAYGTAPMIGMWRPAGGQQS